MGPGRCWGIPPRAPWWWWPPRPISTRRSCAAVSAPGGDPLQLGAPDHGGLAGGSRSVLGAPLGAAAAGSATLMLSKGAPEVVLGRLRPLARWPGPGGAQRNPAAVVAGAGPRSGPLRPAGAGLRLRPPPPRRRPGSPPSGAARPDGPAGSAPARGAPGGGALPRRRDPAGDDHRRPSPHGPGDRRGGGPGRSGGRGGAGQGAGAPRSGRTCGGWWAAAMSTPGCPPIRRSGL
jgi:translation initiation factor IF-2